MSDMRTTHGFTGDKLLLIPVVFVFALSLDPADAKFVACVGDSNTFGFGLADRSDSYPVQLERILQSYDKQWKVANFGRNSATILRQGGLPYWTQSEYQQALAANPDIVIIMFGANGSRTINRGLIQDNYVSDYTDLIKTFSRLPSHPEIWIGYPLKAFTSLGSVSDEIIRDQLIPLMEELASELGLPVIDFYTEFKDAPDLYTSDGIHPNSKGTKLMAELVASNILGTRWAPDFNGDAVINIEDLIILIENWGQDAATLDLAPIPHGDGIVDALDLQALMRFWEKELSLNNHWAFDETEGDIAQDSAGEGDGIVLGDAVWQPQAGRVNGALEFDGIDDMVQTPAVLVLSEAAFSIFAWIKGGAPGQVILSQDDGTDWLSSDPISGNLLTKIKGTARGSGTIRTEAAIVGDNWHRVGIVWDGSYRSLYVDDALVAIDTAHQGELRGSKGGLNVGAGSTQAAGSFWSGMIDELRIYDRVVQP